MKTIKLPILIQCLVMVVASTVHAQYTPPAASFSAVTVTPQGTLSAPTRTAFYGANAPAWGEVSGKPAHFPADLASVTGSLPFSNLSGTSGLVTTTGAQTLSGDTTFSGVLRAASLSATTATIPTLTAAAVLLTNATVSGTLRVTGDLQATSHAPIWLGAAFNNNSPGVTTTYCQLFVSSDGSKFVPLDAVAFTDTIVRDIFIEKIDSWYYAIYVKTYPTPTYSGGQIGMKKSQDLVSWQSVTTPDWSSLIPTYGGETVFETGWFRDDDGTYYILINTWPNGTGLMVTFDPATDTFGTPAPHPGNLMIQGIFKSGSTYHGYTYGPTAHWTAPSVNGPWTSAPSLTPPISGGSHDGGFVIVKPDGTFRRYWVIQGAGQPFPTGTMYFDDSSDLTTWSTPTQITGIPYAQDGFHIVPMRDLQTAQIVGALNGSQAVQQSGVNNFTGTNTFSGAAHFVASTTFAANMRLYANSILFGTNSTTLTSSLRGISKGFVMNAPEDGGAPLQVSGVGGRYLFYIRQRTVPNNDRVVITGGLQNLSEQDLITWGTNSQAITAPGTVTISGGLITTSLTGTIATFSGNLHITTSTSGVVLQSGAKILSGSGSPEAAITAPVGSLYLRSDGGAGTSFYVKESGTGNTGWIAK